MRSRRLLYFLVLLRQYNCQSQVHLLLEQPVKAFLHSALQKAEHQLMHWMRNCCCLYSHSTITDSQNHQLPVWHENSFRRRVKWSLSISMLVVSAGVTVASTPAFSELFISARDWLISSWTFVKFADITFTVSHPEKQFSISHLLLLTDKWCRWMWIYLLRYLTFPPEVKLVSAVFLLRLSCAGKCCGNNLFQKLLRWFLCKYLQPSM